MRVVPALVWARLRHRPLRWLLVVLGLATATVLPVVAQGSTTVVAAQALRHGIAGLPPGQRSLIVSSPGVVLPAADLAFRDARATADLHRLSAGTVVHQLLFRRIADATGGSFFLGAADRLTSVVRITSGRAPTSCTPTRCEVVVVGQGTPTLQPELGLVVVGRAIRTNQLLLAGTFDPGHDAPLLLADGVAATQQLAALEEFQRSFGWVAPLDLDQVLRLGVGRYLAHSADIAEDLFQARSGFVLTAPDQVLQDQFARAQVSARRFTLLSGAGSALLLGFAVIAAIGLRRDQLALLGLLRRRGASRGTTTVVTAAEAVVPVVVGTVLGLAAGGVVAAVSAAHAHLPAADAGWSAVSRALPASLVTAVLAALIVVITSSWAVGAQSRTAWRVVDAAVVVGLATAALAISRGVIGTSALGGGTDPLLTALPVIAVVCGGLLAARAWPAIAAAAGRVMPRGALGARLGLLGVVRRPFRPVATVAFLTAATGIVVFAGGYRSTLQQGAVDQAAFAVPLDAVVRTGSTLERPLDVQGTAAYSAVVPGARAFPVVRSTASVRVSATESSTAELVGVDPDALRLVRSWAHDVGGSTPAASASRVAVAPADTGFTVPDGTTTVALPTVGDLEQLRLVAWFRSAEGRDTGITLTLAGSRWLATLPAPAVGQRMIAVTLSESSDYATKHQHKIGEGGTDVSVLSGHVSFGPPAFVGGPASPLNLAAWAGWGSDNATVEPSGSSMSIAYSFTGSLVVVRPNAGSKTLIPVLTDPATASHAHGGVLEVAGSGDTPLRLQIMGTLPRFPTAGPAFIVADERALADALDSREPGTGSVAELWLWAPDASSVALQRALALPPYDRLAVAARAERQAQLSTDPLAVGAQSLLTFSAWLALLVAVLALVLLVLAERRDESAELYAWESDGVAPRTLRLSLFVRALAVVAVALPAGVVTGLLLSRVTTTLVALTAVGTTPRPPLVLSVGPAWAGGVLAAGLVVGVLASGLVAFGALREPLPLRPEQDLR